MNDVSSHESINIIASSVLECTALRKLWIQQFQILPPASWGFLSATGGWNGPRQRLQQLWERTTSGTWRQRWSKMSNNCGWESQIWSGRNTKLSSSRYRTNQLTKSLSHWCKLAKCPKHSMAPNNLISNSTSSSHKVSLTHRMRNSLLG